jgi:hypothetical protein
MALVACDGTRTYEGKVVAEWERNLYHDSDFFCVVHEGEGADPEFRTIEFATTRAGCGKAFSTAVDAPEELKARYRAWKAECEKRAWKAVWQKDVDDLVHAGVDKDLAEAFATEYPWSFGEVLTSYRTGRRSYEAQKKAAARQLLTAKLRSPFKKDLRRQLCEWLRTPVRDRKYASPFSKKQWEALTQYMRW